MKMELILLCVQSLLLSVQILIAKKKSHKQFLLLCSLVVITIWTVYYGAEDFLNFNVWILLGSVGLAFLSFLISLFIVGTPFIAENVFPIKIFSMEGKLKKTFVNESARNLYSSSYEELLYRWFLFQEPCLNCFCKAFYRSF